MELHNCCVYVSNLPLDLNLEKFEEMMCKYGMIKRDPITNKFKLKLYTDKQTGENKGDGICFFLKPQSVDLALNLLHNSVYEGKTIVCERAKFEMKGEFDPKRAKKKTLTKAQKKRAQENKKKLFEWKLDEEKTYENKRKNHECVVVFKNCFTAEDMGHDVMLKSRIRLSINNLCRQFGEFTKISVYSENSEGVVTVKFKSIPEADLCAQKCNNTLFGSRIITAANWNGKEKFHHRETEEEQEKRIEEWHESLENV